MRGWDGIGWDGWMGWDGHRSSKSTFSANNLFLLRKKGCRFGGYRKPTFTSDILLPWPYPPSWCLLPSSLSSDFPRHTRPHLEGETARKAADRNHHKSCNHNCHQKKTYLGDIKGWGGTEGSIYRQIRPSFHQPTTASSGISTTTCAYAGLPSWPHTLDRVKRTRQWN